MAEAQAAHQAAQGDDEAAAAARVAAATALEEAQEQLRQVVKMQASLKLMQAAQGDLDAAAAAKEASDAAAKAAGAEVSKAARVLTRARKDFEALFDEAAIPPPPEPPPASVPDPTPQPTPVPPTPPKPDPYPQPPLKPKSKSLGASIMGVVGFVLLLIVFSFVRGLLTPKPHSPDLVSPQVAAGADQAMATLRAGIANGPTVAQSLTTSDNLTLELIRSDMAKQDYSDALALALPLANQSNAEAQYDVGAMYLTGEGTAENPTLGRFWLQKAADNGSAAAKIMQSTHREGLGG